MWAAAAEAYATALYDAFREGITDAMPFYAPVTHVDKRFVDYEGIGRPGFAQTLRDNSQFPPVWLGGHDTSDSIDLVPTEPLYLSRDGFLDPLRLLSLAIDPSIDVAILDTVGAAGITDEMIPTSAESGQWTCRPTSGAVLALASDSLEGWASADRRQLLGPLCRRRHADRFPVGTRAQRGDSDRHADVRDRRRSRCAAPRSTTSPTGRGRPPSPVGPTAWESPGSIGWSCSWT